MATTVPTGMTVDPLVEPTVSGRTRSGALRVETIDVMRGLVIAIMVLDHVRDFFHIEANQFDPTDPSRTYLALFLTRWVTHLCAPTFVFLSGVSIYLQRANGKTGTALTRFLISRGVWLVFLEVTVVMFAWNFGTPFWLLQVIWAIGWAMVGMAALAHLPSRMVLGIGIALVALSPLALPAFQPVSAPSDLAMVALFGSAPVAGAPIFIGYAIVPWLGVMAMGFGLGPVFAMEPGERRRRLTLIGALFVTLFFLMRSLNAYGDPAPWQGLAEPLGTAMSYFNISKYPPSPDYVAITLGLSMLIFCLIENLRGPLARILGDFGRTPLFTYVAHLYIAHGLMLAAAIAVGRPEAAIGVFAQVFSGSTPAPFGWSLPVVYGVWLLVLAMLVPLSRWMADVKRRRRDWWLSYI